jgi:beta-glucanase (GH16 family)
VAYTTILDVPAPPALMGHAYKLKFQENFYNLDVDFKPYSTEFHQWVNGIWYDPPDPTADIQAADGVGTLTWHKGQTSPNTTIRTMQSFRYGYFEAYLRFDAIEGSWPAFWMLCAETMNDRTLNGGEFDVMEWVSSTPTKCFYNFHKWAPNGSELPVAEPRSATFNAPDGFDFNDYHKYAIHWTPGNVDCYLDDVWYGNALVDRQIELSHYYLMLGSQAGLDWRDDPETLAKIEADQIQMQIKWVRVWQAQAS